MSFAYTGAPTGSFGTTDRESACHVPWNVGLGLRIGFDSVERSLVIELREKPLCASRTHIPVAFPSL